MMVKNSEMVKSFFHKSFRSTFPVIQSMFEDSTVLILEKFLKIIENTLVYM